MNNKAVNEYSQKSIGGKSSVPFAVVEAYKTIRTNIIYGLSQSDKKIVTVSSCLPGEGKTTTVINVAIALSQLGKKTLVLEADLRVPSLYRKLHLQNQKGLSSVLVGFNEVSEVINKINANLDVITSGPTPPNPSELLSSKSMDALLEKLSKEYDYIVIDTPPIDVVTDALALVPKTAGLLMVIQDRSTTHDVFQKTLSAIELADTKLLGVVINNSVSNGSYYRRSGGKGYRYRSYSYRNKYDPQE